jgi:hypothetical protein
MDGYFEFPEYFDDFALPKPFHKAVLLYEIEKLIFFHVFLSLAWPDT